MQYSEGPSHHATHLTLFDNFLPPPRFFIHIKKIPNSNGIINYFLILGNQQPVMIQQPMTMAPPGYTMEPNGYTSEKY